MSVPKGVTTRVVGHEKDDDDDSRLTTERKPFLWHVPRSVGRTVYEALGGRYGLRLASDAGKSSRCVIGRIRRRDGLEGDRSGVGIRVD